MLLLDLYKVIDDNESLYFTVDNECYYYNFSDCPVEYLIRQVKKLEYLQNMPAYHAILF